MKELKARDVMSSNVVSISPKATVITAAKLMLDNQVSGLAVLDDGGSLVGIVSEADLLRRPEIGTQTIDCGDLEMRIVRGFMVSGISRTKSMCRSPF